MSGATGARRVPSSLAALAAAGLAAVCIRSVQAPLAERLHGVHETDDVYVLPPPRQLRAMTLGYTAAATDLLWGKLLVEYGIHHAEKRPFRDIEAYLEAILALEPDYPNVFKYADVLLVYRPPRGYEADARTARSFLERSLQARPFDGQAWLHYGDFLAFIAPSFLTDEAEIQAWRQKGAEALLRAGELGAGGTRMLSAAAMLGRSGQRDAAIRQLEKSYALTDDPAERERIAAELAALEASKTRERVVERVAALEEQWRAVLPFLPRAAFLLVGPRVDPWPCAGLQAGAEARCARSWPEALGPEEP